MLYIKDLTFYYKKTSPIFTDLSLKIEEGKIYGILGKNGIGKSTLLYLMAGILFPKKGTITLNNQPIPNRHPDVLNKFFFIPDEFDLPPLALRLYIGTYAPFYPEFNYEQMAEYLSFFEIHIDEKKTPLSTLSLGEKKKVLISFALASNTAILLMDEPTNGLDIEGKSKFRKLLTQAMTDQKTFIISTHQVKEVDRLLEHIIILGNNTIYLNESVTTITEKLAFIESTGKTDSAEVLYSQPSVSGNSLIVNNTEQIDTELNLKLLYNALSHNHTAIKELFNN